jgi:hypothetical protein
VITALCEIADEYAGDGGARGEHIQPGPYAKLRHAYPQRMDPADLPSLWTQGHLSVLIRWTNRLRARLSSRPEPLSMNPPANPDAQDLLHWIIDKVIAHRRARAFLLKSNTRHPLIDALFGARLLHVMKRSISGQEEPGVRYDAYKLDYGCYVDLLATTKAPIHQLFETQEDTEEVGASVKVPTDDYRAIRRAILDLTEFESRTRLGNSNPI